VQTLFTEDFTKEGLKMGTNGFFNSFSINCYVVENAFRYYFDEESILKVFIRMHSCLYKGWYVGIVFTLGSVLVDPYYKDCFDELIREVGVIPSHVE
jgi:hypothetical protein